MEVLEILNPWWKEGRVSKELSLPYRRHQFNELKKLLRVRPVTVISGLRRVGKSVLIYQLIEALISSGTNPRNILYFSFDQKTSELLDVLQEYSELAGTDWKKEHIYVFLDEVQKLSEWSNKLKLVYDQFPNIKFIISGSSSFNLQKDAIKNLAGRHFEVNITPLSFSEYLEMSGSRVELSRHKLWETEIRKEFGEYLTKPYPELVKYKELSLIKAYIKENVVDKILNDDLSIFKDINEELATTMINIFYDNPGMYVNYDKLSADLKVSKKTLLRHVFYLEFSYLIRKIKNYRPATRSVSRKMQRIYPYHFSLMFGWNGKLNLECIVSSFYGAKYYWNENRREVDIILQDGKLTPIEVKEAEHIGSEDLAGLRYFMSRFGVSRSILVYNGEDKKINEDKLEIHLLPAWKLLMDQNNSIATKS